MAVLSGLLAGLLRARLRKRSISVPTLRAPWLALIALLPQVLAFQVPVTRAMISDPLAGLALVATLSLLFVFVWLNRKLPGFWLMGVGLVLNLAVIAANGGLMPISPETVARIVPEAPANSWKTGERFEGSKDIILAEKDMYLPFLADRFLLPDWIPYRVAFSAGDIFIAVGVFWLLWSTGGPAAPGRTISEGV